MKKYFQSIFSLFFIIFGCIASIYSIFSGGYKERLELQEKSRMAFNVIYNEMSSAGMLPKNSGKAGYLFSIWGEISRDKEPNIDILFSKLEKLGYIKRVNKSGLFFCKNEEVLHFVIINNTLKVDYNQQSEIVLEKCPR